MSAKTVQFYDREYYAKKDIPTDQLGRLKAIEQRANQFYRDQIDPKPGESLLDVGCGKGDFLSTLKGSQVDLWGIDISQTAINKAKPKVDKPEQLTCADALPLPYDDEKFDWVTAWGVVEHFPCQKTILKEIYRVTKKDGKAVIMVPNLFYYKFLWDNFFKGKGPVRHQEIEFLYAFAEWKAMIEQAGFTITKTSRHNKFNKPKSMWFRNLTIPFYLSNHFVFVCRK